MTSKKVTRSTSTLISILACVAILAAVNFFLYSHYARRDLTESKLFTISNATKSMLQKMKDDVNVTLYRSENLPAVLLSDYRFTKEFLEEMSVLSGGKLNLKIEIPKEDKDTEQGLARKGIRRQQINVLQKDEYKSSAIYYHLLIQHLDKTKALPFPQPLTLEYGITSALLEVTQREKPVVTFVTNDPEFQFNDMISILRERLGMGDRYDIRTVALDKDQELRIPKNCKTIVLVKPKDLKDPDLYALDQFVMRGGTLVAFVDMIDFNNPAAMFQPAPPPNIVPLLDTYGIKVNRDLVQDFKSYASRTVPVGRQGLMTFTVEVPYPQWVIAQGDNFDKENPALSFQQALLLPYPSSLEFTPMAPQDVKRVTLISTTDKALAQGQPPFDLQPPQELKVPENTKKYMVAGLVTGPLVSYYKDREKPKKPAPDPKNADDPLSSMAKDENEDAPKLDKAENGRVLVVSTAQLLNLEVLRSAGQLGIKSLFFLENLTDWLSLGTDLIAIRTKPVKEYPLKRDMSDADKAQAKFLGRFAIPVVVVIAGVAWWLIRRRRLQNLAQVYAQ